MCHQIMFYISYYVPYDALFPQGKLEDNLRIFRRILYHNEFHTAYTSGDNERRVHPDPIPAGIGSTRRIIYSEDRICIPKYPRDVL